MKESGGQPIHERAHRRSLQESEVVAVASDAGATSALMRGETAEPQGTSGIRDRK